LERTPSLLLSLAEERSSAARMGSRKIPFPAPAEVRLPLASAPWKVSVEDVYCLKIWTVDRRMSLPHSYRVPLPRWASHNRLFSDSGHANFLNVWDENRTRASTRSEPSTRSPLSPTPDDLPPPLPK